MNIGAVGSQLKGIGSVATQVLSSSAIAGAQGIMGPVGPRGAPGFDKDSITVYMQDTYVSIAVEDLPEDIRDYMVAQIIAQKLEGNRPTYGNSSTSGCTGPTGPSGPTGLAGPVYVKPHKRSWFSRK